MLAIKNIELSPAPDIYNVGIMDISVAERNTAGTINIERVATKRKISLGWHYLNNNDCSKILALVAPVFFYVNYIDPQTGTANSGTFYCGDRTAEGITYRNGQMYWKNIKFDLVER